MKAMEEKAARILLVLEQAKGPAPVGYIVSRSGIETPERLLAQLEEDALIYRVSPSQWSASNEPQYELTPRTKEILQQLIVTRLEQLVEMRA